MKNVLVTCPPMISVLDEYPDRFDDLGWEIHAPEFQQEMEEEALLDLIPGFHGWIIGDDPATRRVMEVGKKGKLEAMVKWGVGTDNVDFDAAQELDLPVSNTPGVFADEVADVALGYLVNLAHGLVAIDRGVRRGDWPKLQGVSLQGRTAGIVGLGSIGSTLAQRLDAIGMDVIGYDPYTEPPSIVGHREWPEALDQLDALILTCPLTPETRDMLDAKALEQLPDRAFIVNVARGGLLDQQALSNALAAGELAGAALDVFRQEPLPTDDPLTDREDVILGSHNASNTQEGVQRATTQAIDTLERFFEGNQP